LSSWLIASSKTVSAILDGAASAAYSREEENRHTAARGKQTTDQDRFIENRLIFLW
jgi:hypothetical protein